MKRTILSGFLLIMALAAVATTNVTPSVSLTSYYSAANGKSGSALRTALQGCIDDHTVVSYSNLSYLLKYADTEDADGITIIDLYTTCVNTSSASGTSITWGTQCSGTAAQNIGCNSTLNREHSVPQSWFSKASPMVSDAFHIYAVDAVANGHRSDNYYGVCPSGTSYSGSDCDEAGRLGANTFRTDLYSGTVYEVPDEYKGDIARSYFYMATRYADVCASWGKMFGSDNQGLTSYTAALMLAWHRADPVSEKERLRNEVIYGNTTYNHSNYKQNNRNPFIDYPELVEYIWGNRAGQTVTVANLVSSYSSSTTTPTLRSIAISGNLTTTAYNTGDAPSYSGLTVTGTYSDNSTADLTSQATWTVSPTTLTASTTQITVTATVGTVSATQTYNVTVAAPTLQSIAISGSLTTTVYNTGDAPSYAGLTATGTYSDGSTADLTQSATWTVSPSTLAASTTQISVTAKVGTVSATKTYSVTVTTPIVQQDAQLEVGFILTVGQSCPGFTMNTTSDGTITYSSSNTAAVTVDEATGVITAVGAGEAVITATAAESDTYESISIQYSVTVSNE